MTNPWKLVLPSVLLGIFIGAAGGAWMQRRAFNRVPNTERALKHLSAKLELDAGQRESVKTILEERRKKMTSLRQECLAKSREVKSSMREDIKKVLRPDQLPKYDAMNARFDARRKETPFPDRKEAP